MTSSTIVDLGISVTAKMVGIEGVLFFANDDK